MHCHHLVCVHCGSHFFICSSCFRCQRYCSEICKFIGYRSNQRRANRKHALSLEGRLDNRDRNREYRKRKCSKVLRVTDKSSAKSLVSLTSVPVHYHRCIKCGTKVSNFKGDLWVETQVRNGFRGTP